MADHEARIDLGIRGLGPAEHIGRGGFADVYKAEQISLRRTVAVKVLRAQASDAETEARFERECHAIGAVSAHPPIIGVHEGGFTRNGRAYLVMEYLPGGSLRDHLDDSGPLPVDQVVDIGIKIARALAEAHRAGVLHRDVKPANIMISAYGEPALGDFGIARIEGGHQTATGLVTASFAHAAPEVLEGMAPTAGADIYSLGTTIYELMIGRPPYYDPADESIWPLMKRILSEPMPSPESVGMSRQLGRVFLRATDRDPGMRYADADQLADELMVLSGDVGALSRNVTDLPATAWAGSAESRSGKETRTATSFDGGRPPNLLAGAPPVVGTPGGPPAPKPDLTSLRNPDTEIGAAGPDETGRFRPIRGAARLSEPLSVPAVPPNFVETVEKRRGGGLMMAIALLAVAAIAAGAFFVTDPLGSDEVQEAATSTVVAAVAEAGGPLQPGVGYEVSLDAAPAAARFRLVIDGEAIGAPSPEVPQFVAAAGRHSVAVEISTTAGSELTASIEYYGMQAPQDPEYVANLQSVEVSLGWDEALAVFDQLTDAGHDNLLLAASDGAVGRTAEHWMIYVPGFGEVASDAEDYCRRFDLAIPTSCYAGYHQPVS